jgi:hypothetical protein
MRWLQAVLILSANESVKNSLSVVSCGHFYEKCHLDDFFVTWTLYFFRPSWMLDWTVTTTQTKSFKQ